jgi:hypothetical protein
MLGEEETGLNLGAILSSLLRFAARLPSTLLALGIMRNVGCQKLGVFLS